MDFWVFLETVFPKTAQCLVLSDACCASVTEFRRRFPCRGAEAVSRGPDCLSDQREISLLLDKVINALVVQVVQLPRWSRRAENCGFPQLQFSDTLVACPLLSTTGLGCAADAVLAVMDVPVIMQRRCLATVKVPQVQFIALFEDSRCATETGTHSAAVLGGPCLAGMVAARGSLLQFCSIFRPPSIWTLRLWVAGTPGV